MSRPLAGMTATRRAAPHERGTAVRGPWALLWAFGALLRRTLPAIGAALAGFTVLIVAARWTVQALTPASKTTGPHFTAPPGSWILGSGTRAPVPYHQPASTGRCS